MMMIITTNLHLRALYVNQILKTIDTKYAKQLKNTHISKMESNSRRLKNQQIEY